MRGNVHTKRKRDFLKKILALTATLTFTLVLGTLNLDFVFADETAAGGSSSPDSEMWGNAIYLNGQSGDDSRSGLSADDSVRTFTRAKEMALANKDIKTIYITGSVNITGDISLEGTSAIVKRGSSFTGYLMRIRHGDSAVLKNITIDGNSDEASGTEKSLIYDQGSLTIEDGTVLKNNVLRNLDYFKATGGAVRVEDGKLAMTGGTIEDNAANYGGGVYLYYKSEMTMSGGIIQNNKAVDGTESGTYGYAAGGGIALYDGSILNLSENAEIKNNQSENMGGGISLGTGSGGEKNLLNMTGGAITGNSSGAGGGGILIQAGISDETCSTANISGGTISNNTMTGKGSGNKAFGGGGIYVNGYAVNGTHHNAVLNLSNALITENSAKLEGGGYAACPISSTEIYLDNGCAIYNNTGDRAKDIYILASLGYGAHSGNPFYTIPNTMMGGTPYHWKDERGNEVALNHLKGQLHYGSSNYELLLSSDVRHDEAAQDYAKVKIIGNTSATRGGGIGSNGTVNIGHSDTRELKVTKKWETKKELPESITVNLFRTVAGSDQKPVHVGHEIIKPDKDGKWSLIFTNLPEKDSSGRKYEYSVEEAASGDYISQVEGNMDDGFVITNRDQEYRDISVVKKWYGVDAENAPEVTVYLVANGSVQENQMLTLNSENHFRGAFKNLNTYDKNGKAIVYSVIEKEISGYRSSVTGNAAEGFTITNTLTNPKNNKTEKSKEFPQTGDPLNESVYVFVFSGAVAILIGLLRRFKH